MRQKLLALIPEFQLIKNRKLQEKTIEIWEKALIRGGWKIEDLKKMPFTLLLEKTSVNIIEHTRAVTLCALDIAKVLEKMYEGKIAIQRDFLLSGALLHDIGKLFEFQKEKNKFVTSKEGNLLRHPISGAAFAFQLGLPQEIIHIIAAHSKEGDGARKTIEAILVNHADFVNFDIFKI